jgi:hypothetical protein
MGGKSNQYRGKYLQQKFGIRPCKAPKKLGSFHDFGFMKLVKTGVSGKSSKT